MYSAPADKLVSQSWLNFVVFESCFEFTSSELNDRAEERSWRVVNIETGFHHTVLMS